MKERRAEFFEKAIGICLFLAACFFLVRSFILSFSTDIWYDELFSMEFAEADLKELVSLTARDVHPPLYYIILKFFLAFPMAGTAISYEAAAKLVSIIPFILLFIYSLTKVRKSFGIVASGFFCFAIVSMPALPEYTTEIRMYSWAMLFVTAALLHGFSLMNDFQHSEKKWNAVDGPALWLFGTAAAYTHYYAALSIGIIYALILGWMLVKYIRRMRSNSEKTEYGVKALAELVICGNLTVISFIPWVGALFFQVSAVKANYWIQPVGLRTFGSCVKYMFSGYFESTIVTVAVAVVLFILSASMLIGTAVSLLKTKEAEYAEQLIAFMVVPILVCVGILASVLIRPVFVSRYMVPAFGAFYLALSIGIGRFFSGKGEKSVTKLCASVLAILVIITGCIDFKAFIGNEEYRKVNMDKTLELFEALDSDTVIISNFNHVQALLAYYLNSGKYEDADYKIYLYYSEPEELIRETVDGLYTIEDPVDIYNYLSAGKKVLFLGSFNSREALLEEWNQDYCITYENRGSYLMERYWFDVFELETGTGEN